MDQIEQIQQIPIQTEPVISSVLALLVAFLLALPTAWNRERGQRRMGLRTFPLVAMASCAYVLIGVAITGESPESLARIIQGLITGVGFIGGAILKSEDEVRGASTAAAIWATGAIGAAVALDRHELAISIAVMTFLVFLVLTPVREVMDRGSEEE